LAVPALSLPDALAQVVLAIAASLLGATLASRFSTSIYAALFHSAVTSAPNPKPRRRARPFGTAD
jgi:hypothetical protein